MIQRWLGSDISGRDGSVNALVKNGAYQNHAQF